MTARDIVQNEKNFLGSLLRSPHEFWKISDQISPEMFSISHHKDIYGAIHDIMLGGRQLSMQALLAHLPPEYEDAGPTIGILATLKENAMEAGSALDYADPIAQSAGTRRLASIGKWLRDEISAAKRSPEEISTDLALMAQEISAVVAAIRPVRLGDITNNVLKATAQARDKDLMPGLDTGLPSLDDLIGLLMPGDFIAVMASISEGKSALLAQIAKHVAAQGHPVLSAHNEMGLEQNGVRAMAEHSGVPIRAVREGSYDFAGYDALKTAHAELSGMPHYLYFDPRMTLSKLKARALRMKRTHGLRLLVVDGAKRLRVDGKIFDKWEKKEEITGVLKEMAMELEVPVIAAFQRTRFARRGEESTPKLDDAQFPSLEEDADTIVAVWREVSWLMMNKPPAKAGGEAMEEWEHKVRRAEGTAKMIGLKVRSGKQFEWREFKWNGASTRFETL